MRCSYQECYPPAKACQCNFDPRDSQTLHQAATPHELSAPYLVSEEQSSSPKVAEKSQGRGKETQPQVQPHTKTVEKPKGREETQTQDQPHIKTVISPQQRGKDEGLQTQPPPGKW